MKELNERTALNRRLQEDARATRRQAEEAKGRQMIRCINRAYRKSVIPLKKTLATIAAITTLTQMQEGISCHWDILDNLYPIVVHTVRHRPTTGTDLLSAG